MTICVICRGNIVFLCIEMMTSYDCFIFMWRIPKEYLRRSAIDLAADVQGVLIVTELLIVMEMESRITYAQPLKIHQFGWCFLLARRR